MNLIYTCVFYKKSYIELLKLLLTSISIKSKIDKETDILIITSSEFKQLIEKEVEYLNLPIYYFIMEVDSIFDSACARLNIFSYKDIRKYKKILYLDTDTLFNSDMNVLFNLNISPEKLYVLEEGYIYHEYWGSFLFDFSKTNPEQPGFTTGIIYFCNTKAIELLFIKIQDTIKTHLEKNKIPLCLDQPYIVYEAVMQDMYDNQLMKKYFENNPSQIDKYKIVYHFPGDIGNYEMKSEKMLAVWKMINGSDGILTDKKYLWESKTITFLENGYVDAFGKGTYTQLDSHTFLVNFGFRNHIITFTDDYKYFASVRRGDLNVIIGEQII
jgi:hypothetical protein